ncbi:MAG: hypothetical protein ACXACB_15500 [Promethearchaeota archaeon]
MKNRIKLNFYSIIILGLIILSTIPILPAYLQEDPIEELIAFIEEVAQIDMTIIRPSHQVGPNIETLERLGETIESVDGKFYFMVNEGPDEGAFVGSALYTILDGTINFVVLTGAKGTSNINEEAAKILERYQTYLGDSPLNKDLDKMKNLAGKVNIENPIVLEDNVKLELLRGNSFKWTYNYHGVDYPGIVIEFRDGVFRSFGDKRDDYRIGDTEVNISEEQAIAFALDHARAFSFECENGTVVELGIKEEVITASLEYKSRHLSKEYYPIWMVDVPLDMVYDQIFFIRVMFWTNDGEVDKVQPLGYGIGLITPEHIVSGHLIVPSDPPVYSSPTPSPSSDSSFFGSIGSFEIGFVIIACLIGIGLVSIYSNIPKLINEKGSSQPTLNHKPNPETTNRIAVENSENK